MGILTRDAVFEIVSDERDYQDDMVADASRPDMKPLTVGEILFAIEENVKRAREVWYKGAEPHPSAMHYVRKIAALGVQAGENYGMTRRRRP